MGTEKFLNSLSDILQTKLGFSKTKLQKKINCKALCYGKGGKQNVLIFKDFIYKDATVYLKRKKEIFEVI